MLSVQYFKFIHFFIINQFRNCFFIPVWRKPYTENSVADTWILYRPAFTQVRLLPIEGGGGRTQATDPN